MQKHYTTPGGYRRLQRRLENARLAYKRLCSTNEEAAQAGDNCVWHDNFAYEENQRQMHQLAHRVHELEVLFAVIEVINPSLEFQHRVKLGVRVRIQIDDEDEEKVVCIAGYEDGDPQLQRISYNTPLGQALIGREKGDTCKMRVGDHIREIEVIEILPPPQDEMV